MRVCFFILVLLVSSLASFAQENYQVSSYGVDEGVPQSSIWDITQDRNGFLWAGTSDGLCRFDGYKFTVYKNKPADSTSICGNRDHKFYVDKTGRLWIVCWDGISIYNDLKDNFTTVFRYQPALASDNFSTIFGEDDKYIWTGLSNFGLIKVDKQNGRATRIANVDGGDLVSFKTWSSGFVDHGNIYLCTGQGLYVYGIAANKISLIARGEQLSSVADLNDSELVAGGDRCLLLFNKRKQTSVRIPINLGSDSPEIIADILLQPDGQLILACHKGLFYFDLYTRKIVRNISSFDTQQKNKYSFARCVYVDQAKNLWIGTNGDGLKKINYPYKKFLAYNSHSQTSNLVKSVYADSAHVYVGYFNNGLDIFDRKNGFCKNVSFLPPQYGGGNSVYAVTPVSEQALLLHVASGNKIFLYDKATEARNAIAPTIERLIPGFENLETMYPFFTRDSGGQIVTAFGSSLVALYCPGAIGLNPHVVHVFSGETLCCCYKDITGTLWVGTMNCLYSNKGGQWTKVTLPEHVQVKCVNTDREGNLWVGTVKGIYVLDKNNRAVKYYSEANGLVNQFVYGILRDNDGNMWFSHNKGLTVYRVKAGTFRHYFKEDGLQSSEFNTNAYFKASDGTLFFGGIYGVNAFNPREILDNPLVPPVKITSIKLFDEPLRSDTAYWDIRSLTLPYTQNSLSFEFAAIEFTNPANNQYAYTMEGVDNAWIRSGDKRFARYAGLPPGQYTFKVKASNNDGVWQETPAVIQITILPPYWQRLWFRLLMVLLLTGGVAGIIYNIQKQKHQRQIRALELQQKIQLERERISRDLHDNVGTQLSLISNNIEWVAHPVKAISEEEKADKLNFVNETAREIIATLRETIWALNKQEIPLEEFSDKLKSFVQKQLIIYPGIELNFIERIEQAIILGPSEALNLFRICQEAIANALKYADATVIDIELQSGTGKYKVRITDNGKGFDISAVSPAIQNGLENMKHRAQDIGSAFEIRSDSNGTKVTVTKK